MYQYEAVKKAFELAKAAYYDVFIDNSYTPDYPSDEFIRLQTIASAAAVGPMAAEIYRGVTRPVLVTIEKPEKEDVVRRLGETLTEAGYTGNVTFKFPEDKPIEVTIEETPSTEAKEVRKALEEITLDMEEARCKKEDE